MKLLLSIIMPSVWPNLSLSHLSRSVRPNKFGSRDIHSTNFQLKVLNFDFSWDGADSRKGRSSNCRWSSCRRNEKGSFRDILHFVGTTNCPKL